MTWLLENVAENFSIGRRSTRRERGRERQREGERERERERERKRERQTEREREAGHKLCAYQTRQQILTYGYKER